MRRLVAAACAVVAGGAFGQKPDSDRADQATFRAVCGSCHAITLVEGLRTEEEWRDEIAQMIKIGARGTPEQFERVMRVLTRTLTKVNINTADAKQIAPVLDLSDSAAEALIKRRKENGNFSSIEELKKIPGMDAAKLESRKDRIAF